MQASQYQSDWSTCACLHCGALQGCTLPGFSLTSATWRLVLGQPPQPEHDLASADPMLYRNLQLLRQLGADVAALGLHFEQHDALGRAVSHAMRLAGHLAGQGMTLSSASLRQ